MTLVARAASHSDVGLHRPGNEDACLVQPPLYAVADGMGGAQAGEVASTLAVATLGERVAAGDALAQAATAANAKIYEQAAADPEHSGMGTTLTAVCLRGSRAEVVHVGDSRLYLLRDGVLEQVSDDHSLVREWLRAGTITSDEAAASRYRNVLTRALGTEPDVTLDTRTLELRRGDLLVLSTDGLHSLVPDVDIGAVLAAGGDLEVRARRLVSEAKNRGGYDNITVVLVRLDEEGEEPAEDETQSDAAAGDDEPAASAPPPASATATSATAAPPPAAPASLMRGVVEAPVASARRQRRRRFALATALLAVAGLVALAIVAYYTGWLAV